MIQSLFVQMPWLISSYWWWHGPGPVMDMAIHQYMLMDMLRVMVMVIIKVVAIVIYIVLVTFIVIQWVSVRVWSIDLKVKRKAVATVMLTEFSILFVWNFLFDALLTKSWLKLIMNNINILAKHKQCPILSGIIPQPKVSEFDPWKKYFKQVQLND